MIAILEASLVRPLGLVVVAWVVLRVFRVRHPASRHAVWTAVLAGMLLLPIVSVVGPRWTLAVLPVTAAVDTRAPIGLPPTVTTADAIVEAAARTGDQPAAATSAPVPFAWPSPEAVITGGYIAGVGVMAMYRLMGWMLLRRVLSRSTKLRPACLRESADVVTPVAVGVVRPSVILPAGWRRWEAPTKRAVLAHELAHLRRGDTLVAALARFVTTVLWFHPVAWWVSRKTAELAELACDAVALERVGDPARYSRVLVEFASAVHRAGRRVALPGLAIASRSRMNDRVDQVFEMSGGTMRKLMRPRLWLLAIGVPALYLAATVAPVAATSQAPAAKAPQFDVVSIKPCPDVSTAQTGRGAGPNLAQTSPGHVYWACVTLASLADQAYAGWDFPLLNRKDRPLAFENFGRRADRDDDSARIRGGPSWVYTERFAIEATASVDVISPAGGNLLRLPAPMNQALRAMLADRFKLEVRRETEERPMYALTVAKSGLKARPRTPEDCLVPPADARGRPRADGFWEGQWLCGIFATAPLERLARFWAGEKPETLMPMPGPNRRTEYRGVTLQAVAERLSDVMDRFVLDKTGVGGEFLFAVEYTTNENAPGGGLSLIDRPAGPGADRQPKVPEGRGETIFQAFESVGLKIETTKGPAEYLVISRAERPAPNAPAATTPPARAQSAPRPR